MSDPIYNQPENNPKREPQKKSYYSVNLTEGRVFVIFVSVIAFLVLGAFISLFIFSNINKKNAENTLMDSALFEYNTSHISTEESEFSSSSSSSSISSVSNVTSNEIDLSNKTNMIDDTKKNIDNLGTPQLDDTDPIYSSGTQISTIKKIDTSSEVVKNKQYEQDKSNITVPKKKTIVNTTNTATNKTTNTATKKSSQSVSNKRFVIQIGSFSDKKNADSVMSFYKQAGYPVYIVETETNAKRFYRLRVGPFKDKDIADNYLISIKSSKFGQNAYISVVFL